MKRLLTLILLLSSQAYAGFYGGLEYNMASLNGTYEETNQTTNITQKWKMSKTLNTFGINLGYGYADTVSGDVYLTVGDGQMVGTNFKYAFNPLTKDLYPHVIGGVGFVGFSPNFTDNPATPYGDPFISNFFTQLGVGLSYVLNDTVELYGDAFLVYNFDRYVSRENIEVNGVEITADQLTSYQATADTFSIGFQMGVKFHMFGSSTMRGRYLKEEALELEEERQKNIDSIFDD